MQSEIIQLTNHEGILCHIPLAFIGKEACIGDKMVSYQLLRLKKSGLFTIEDLYGIAAIIQDKQPDSLIDWAATFLLLEKDTEPHIRQKLKVLHLA